MKHEDTIKIQAWLDGELAGAEAESVERLIVQDADARALVAELRWTKSALAHGELEREVPESREFYWSKIERAIRAAESAEPAVLNRPWMGLVLRWFAPAGIVAALALFFALPMLRQAGQQPWIAGAEIESPLNDVGSITFRSEAEGMTIVWVNTH
jgi:anti-sigma-K factor RskA